MKLVFFLFFYVLLGTAGITIPMMINQDIVESDISIGLITIVVSTVGYNASEKIMQLFDVKSADNKIKALVCLIALVLVLYSTIYTCTRVKEDETIWIAVITYGLSCVFWWFLNWNNKNIENTNASNALGGSKEQFN